MVLLKKKIMEKQKNKKITIDQLARMMKKSFDNVATKADLEKLATREQVQKVDERLQNLEVNFGGIPGCIKKLEEALEIE